jgi:hypothetical protein
MLRSIVAKVAWLGRTASVVFGLVLVLALLFGVASMALAGTGVGGVFNLGVKNTVNAVTELVSTSGAGPNGPMLRVDNNGTGTAATGVEILTEAGKPPMKVNSATKVANLNADRLDGKDSTALPVIMKTNHQQISECDTPNVSNECAPVTVTVPAGKTYHVTVLSSFSATNTSDRATVSYCSAAKSVGFFVCLTGTGAGDDISLVGDDAASATISGDLEATGFGIGVGPRTWTFSTVINPTEALASSSAMNAHTTVLIRDASVAGPPIN